MTDDSFPIADMYDHEILMHRNAHFGGSFQVMLDYYANEGKGVLPDFEPKRILELKELQDKSAQNLSNLLLSPEEKVKVKKAKDKYLTLRSVYETPSSGEIPKLIADLILTENAEAETEVANLAAQGKKAVKPLIEIMQSDDFYNPLFPGYGQSPAYAAKCLGLIGDPIAIQPLFHALSHKDFFLEEAILEALVLLGDEAREFLLNALNKFPLTKENEQAAIALISFGDDETTAKNCLHLLQRDDVRANRSLSTYLEIACHGLKGNCS